MLLTLGKEYLDCILVTTAQYFHTSNIICFCKRLIVSTLILAHSLSNVGNLRITSGGL